MLTDNEIIKVLEDVIKHLDFIQIKSGQNVLGNALDLINRQKAQIGTLQKAIKVQEIMLENKDHIIKKANAEAYKECIEKVKEKSCKINQCNNDIVVKTYYQISGNTLDNLLKEMGVRINDNI